MVQEFLTSHIDLLSELASLLAMVGGVIVVSAFLLSRFDRIDLEEALYMAFITAFTVGFGDLTPKSRGARVVCVGLAFLGLILVGILVAVSVHALDIVLQSRAG